jgi:signal transduction histidine kinase
MSKEVLLKKIKKIIKKINRSLQLRIILVILISGFISSVIISIGIVESYEVRATTLRTDEVQTQMRILANHLVKYNYLSDASSEVINAELEQLSTLYDGRVLVINKDLKIIKDTYGINQGKTIIAEVVLKCFAGEETTYYDGNNNFIELAIPINEKVFLDDNTEKTNTQGVLLISVSTESITKSIEVLKRNAYILESIIMICFVGVDFILVRGIVKPFNQISESIVKVDEGTMDEILDVPDYAETSQIIEAFNKILAKSRKIDESRKEFVSNVSHELKTPLTSMKVLADSLLSQEHVSNELYQEFMMDIANEIERENEIINDLLELVKLDAKEDSLHIGSTSINENISKILKQLFPIANKQKVELIFESACQVVADVDAMKFSLAISNLVVNAIKYNKENGIVYVKLDADHQFFTIEVRDTGLGIPKKDLRQIFEKFYRVDKSHSKEIGGTGLGLSITRSIILLHKGTIKVESTLEEGSKFLVKIPLFYISNQG